MVHFIMGRRRDPETLQTRERILDAATRAIERAGFSRTTIDDVIAEASISKGGFLYHFPTKLSCFTAVVDRTFNSILEEARQHCRRLPEGPGRMLKAYIIAWLDWQEPPKYLPMMGLIEEEALRLRIMKYRTEHYELVLDGLVPEVLVQSVLLICAGLWTTPPLCPASLEEMAAFRRRMRDVMFDMIDKAAPEAAGEPENAIPGPGDALPSQENPG